MVFTLALLACLATATLFVYESGRLVTQKRRLIDSADAAALSAAIFEARVLNFESYMNRAIVANQAAMAQSVSLRSWLAYMTRTVDRANRITRFVPYLGPATTGLRNVMTGVNRASQPLLVTGEGTLALFTTDFARAADALHLAAAPAALELAQRTAADNFPGASLSTRGSALMGAHTTRWVRLTRVYGGAQRGRQKEVIVRSLDRFTVDRGAVFRVPVIVRLEKRGGTDLPGFDTWRGMDTFALHHRTLFGWREAFQIGWGAAEQGRATSLRGYHGGSYRVNRRTSRTAMRDLRVSRLSRGLPSMRDVARLEPAVQNDLRLDLELEVPIVRVSDPSPGPMTAQASARVFHARPTPRPDRRRELPSLYSPYWQARLATPPRLPAP
ncbi:MAG TPA: pilus assembly protein TadG-related protein [Steroidobacteraceae bacterium]|nr:pilus assembly protein TadG-related protein [Steroidobacteraceae bacterium]